MKTRMTRASRARAIEAWTDRALAALFILGVLMVALEYFKPETRRAIAYTVTDPESRP